MNTEEPASQVTQQPVLHFGTAPSFPSLPRCLWMFACLGPAIGYVIAMLVLTAAGSHNVLEFLRFPAVIALGVFVALPYAYLLGVVPATVVGAVYWTLRAKANLNPLPAVSLCVFVSIVVCAGALVVMDRGGADGLSDPESWGLMMLPGIVATSLCAYIVERRG